MEITVETSVTLHLKNDNWVKRSQTVVLTDDDIVNVLKLDQGITNLYELHDAFLDTSEVLAESIFIDLAKVVTSIE